MLAFAAVAARWQLVGCIVEDDRPVAVRAAVATLARLLANAVHTVDVSAECDRKTSRRPPLSTVTEQREVMRMVEPAYLDAVSRGRAEWNDSLACHFYPWTIIRGPALSRPLLGRPLDLKAAIKPLGSFTRR